MKPAVIALALLVVFTACSRERPRMELPPPPTSAPADAPEPQRPPVPAPAVVVESKPAPAPSGALVTTGTLSFKQGMQKVSDGGVEEGLERWAEGDEIDFEVVKKRVGLYLDVAGKIRWDENKKRSRDPADHDKIARDSIAEAAKLIEAAKAADKDKVKSLSDQLLKSCVDCHTKYK